MAKLFSGFKFVKMPVTMLRTSDKVNRVLRRMFGPKRDKVTGELRKLHNEGLNDLHCSPCIIRVIK
jgi:hypothetical protein